MKYLYYYETSLGPISILEKDNAITNIYFSKINPTNQITIKETVLLKEAKHQLYEYLSGKRTDFTLPLCFDVGTPFQQSVWRALQTIPYGETRSYKQIAEMVGNPKASRAVGSANNKNPISIVVPCHRVIGSSGKLVGYAGGLPLKEKLLSIEKMHIN